MKTRTARRVTERRGHDRLAIFVLLVLVALPLVGYSWMLSWDDLSNQTRPPIRENPVASDGGPRTSATAHPVGKTSVAGTTKTAPPEGGGLKNSESNKRINDSLVGLEVFSSQTDAQLKRVAKLIGHPAKITPAAVRDLVIEEFHCDPLRPAPLHPIFRDRQLVVYRPAEASHSAADADETYGAEAFARALAVLTHPYRDAQDVRAKFKTFRVLTEGDTITTQAYFHVAGTSSDQVIEQTAAWSLRWSVPSPRTSPRLASIEVADFEEVATHAGQGALYGDCTLAVLGDTAAFREQLLYGIGHWRSQFQAEVEVDFRGHHGLALGDVNGDGLDDVYVCQRNGLPNLLLVQQDDGTLRDVSTAAGVDWLDESKSALLIDLDNDGDQDLVISVKHRILIMSNSGDGQFALAADLAGPRRPHSMTAADYDGDGLLDIFVCGFWRYDVYKADPLSAAMALPTPWHDAKNGAPNQLLRNEGGFRFVDVTQQCGLDQNNTRFSHAAAWEDYDNDGDLDLYIANDFGRNNMYRNDAGHFVDVAREAGIEDMAAGMSVAWADFNKDGWMDLYVSNMFSSAGSRVTYHREFQNRLSEDQRREIRRHARGNTLFVNSADNTFRDVSEQSAVVLGRWAWSSNFVDINNDGRNQLQL